MSEKPVPRDNLARPVSAQSAPLAVTGSLIQFLQAELRTYKATVRKKGQRLTNDRLSLEIQLCPAITPPVEFSPETLRRFLNNHPQQHGEPFFRAIAAFLLHEKWITQADIAAHGSDGDLRPSVALRSFFGAQPHKKTLEFYEEIQGAFVRFAMMPDRILRVVLYVSVQYEPPVLRAYEEAVHYRTSAADLILRESEGLKPALYPKAAKLLERYGEQVGAPRYSTGFGIADPKIISFFLRNALSGDTIVYLVHTLAPYNDEDGLDIMLTTRYTGWTMSGDKTEPPRELYRALPGSYEALSLPIARANIM